MKGIPSVLPLSFITRPIAFATVAFLFVSGGTILPKAIAQTVSKTSVAAITPNDPADIDPTSSTMSSPEVRAFLDVISWAETGTVEPISYSTLVFNGFFNDFSTHPKLKQCSPIGRKRVCSTAAGRYQIMGFNWDELAPKLKLKDFSPESQDKMALYFIQKKGAMEDVLAGRFDQAACKVGRIWASFPCNNYGQHPKSMETLKQFYQQRILVYENSGENQPNSLPSW